MINVLIFLVVFLAIWVVTGHFIWVLGRLIVRSLDPKPCSRCGEYLPKDHKACSACGWTSVPVDTETGLKICRQVIQGSLGRGLIDEPARQRALEVLEALEQQLAIERSSRRTGVVQNAPAIGAQASGSTDNPTISSERPGRGNGGPTATDTDSPTKPARTTGSKVVNPVESGGRIPTAAIPGVPPETPVVAKRILRDQSQVIFEEIPPTTESLVGPAAPSAPSAPAAPAAARVSPSVVTSPGPAHALDREYQEDKPVKPPVIPRQTWSQWTSAFLEENNIRWGELVGGLLIVGCSVALVLSFWESIADRPWLKFSIFTGVNAATFGLGLYAWHRWRLPTTSKGILLIGMHLLPLNFLAFALFTLGMPIDAFTVVGEITSLTILGILAWQAAIVLTPSSVWLTTITPIVFSLANLLIRRTVSEDASPELLYAWGGGLLVVYIILNGLSWKGLVKDASGQFAPALEYFSMTAFGVLLAGGLMFYCTGDAFENFRNLSPLICLFAAPALVLALDIGRASERASEWLVPMIVLGSCAICLGALAMVLAVPMPIRILASAAGWLVLIGVTAVYVRRAELGYAVYSVLGIAAAPAYYCLAGQLSWSNGSLDLLLQSVFQASTGFYVVAWSLLCGGFGLALAKAEQPASSWVAIRSAVIYAGIGTLTLTAFGLGRESYATSLGLVYAAHAVTAFTCGLVLRKPWIEILGIVFLSLATFQGIAVGWVDSILAVRAYTCTSVVASALLVIMMIEVALLRRDSPSRLISDVSLISLIATSGTSISGFMESEIVGRNDMNAFHIVSFFMSALLWLLYSSIQRSRTVWRIAECSGIAACLIVVISQCKLAPWWGTGTIPYLHPSLLQHLCIAIFLLAAISLALQHVSIALSKRGTIRWANTLCQMHDGTVACAGITGASILTIAIMAYGVFPGTAQELLHSKSLPMTEVSRYVADGEELERFVPASNAFELAGIPHAAASWGIGSESYTVWYLPPTLAVWIVGGSVLLFGFWTSRRLKVNEEWEWMTVAGVLAMAICFPLASVMEPSVSVASALRWLSALMFFSLCLALSAWINRVERDKEPEATKAFDLFDRVFKTLSLHTLILWSVMFLLVFGSLAVSAVSIRSSAIIWIGTVVIATIGYFVSRIKVQAVSDSKELKLGWWWPLAYIILALIPVVIAWLFRYQLDAGVTLPILPHTRIRIWPFALLVTIVFCLLGLLPTVLSFPRTIVRRLRDRSDSDTRSMLPIVFTTLLCTPLVSWIILQTLSAIEQFPVTGPNPGSLFAQIGAPLSYAIPVLMVFFALLHVSVSRPSPNLAFISVLVLKGGVTVGYMLLVDTFAGNGAAVVGLMALLVLTGSIFNMLWRAYTNRDIRSDSMLHWSGRPVALVRREWQAALGYVNVGYHSVGTFLILLMLLAQNPGTNYALTRDSLPWAALGMLVATVVMFLEQRTRSVSVDISPWIGAVGVSILGLIGPRVSGVENQLCLAAVIFCVSGVAMLVNSMRRIGGVACHGSPVLYLSSLGFLLGFIALRLLAFNYVTTPIVLGFAVWLMLVANSVLHRDHLSWWFGLLFSQLAAIVSGLVVLNTPSSGMNPIWVAFLTQCIGMSLSSGIGSATGFGRSVRSPLIIATTLLVLCTVYLFVPVVSPILDNFVGPVNMWLFGLAIGSCGVAGLTGFWSSESRDEHGVVYFSGLCSVVWLLLALQLKQDMALWQSSVYFAAYCLATSYLWRSGTRISEEFTRLLRLPPGLQKSPSVLVVQFNLLIALMVAGLGVAIQFLNEDTAVRLLCAQTIMGVTFATGLLARYVSLKRPPEEDVAEFTQDSFGANAIRVLSLCLGVLYAVTLFWHVQAIQETPLLDRIAVSLLPLTLVGSLYGFGLVKWVRLKTEWQEAATLIVPWVIAAAIVGGLVCVCLEFKQATPEGSSSLGFYPAICIALAFVGSMLMCLTAAVLPGNDPLGLSERARQLYVYIAQVILVLLLLQLRLTFPWMFGGWLQQFWPLLVLALGFGGLAMSEWTQRRGWTVLAEPLRNSGGLLPLLPIITPLILETSVNYGLSLVAAAVGYGLFGYLRRSSVYIAAGVLATNAAIWYVLYRNDLSFNLHPLLWVVPPAVCIFAAVQLLRRHLSKGQVATARYLSIGAIYVSSTSEIFLQGISEAPWLPIVLAVLSVCGILFGIAARIRSMLWMGMMFLCVSIFSMLWYAAVDLEQTWIWYVSGIVLGLVILIVFGYFEKRRENLKLIVSKMQQWEE